MDNGVREFSIDQSSGKITEISVPLLAVDNGIRDFSFDPSGRFLIVAHKNSATVYTLNPGNGSLTQVGPTYAIGDNLTAQAFAIF